MTDVLLGVDVGTSSLKAVAISPRGELLAQATRCYPTRSPRPGWAEQEPEEWWQACREAVQEVVGKAGAELLALGFTGQMHSFVLLDEGGRPLRPAITWCDTRAAGLLEEIQSRLADRGLLERLGNPVVLGLTLAPLVWLARHEPLLLERARHLLLAKDYLRYRVSGRIASEPTDASATLLYDFDSDGWFWQVADLFALPRRLLPPLEPSFARCGAMLKPELFGVAGRPIVACGAGDQQAAAVANGVIEPGRLQLMVGTGAQVLAPVPEPHLAEAGLHLFRHVGGWIVQGSVQNAGLALGWARKALSLTWEDFYRSLEGDETGHPLFLPYLTGERTPLMDSRARGAWLGLSHGHGPRDLARAAVEGVALSIADALHHLRQLESVRHDPVVRSGGGVMNNRSFAQLLSDAAGVPLTVLESGSASAVGAAILAGVAAGLYEDVKAGAEEAGLSVKVGFEPNMRRHEQLQERLQVMRRLYDSELFALTGALER